MNFTFGIITDGKNDTNINKIVESIEIQKIPEYEIIIVGNSNVTGKKIIQIPFNENIKQMWITKKKNTITKNAKYENIVYLHDYVYLLEDWYDGFLKFGNNFNFCMTKIKNFDDTRFRDWTLWAYDVEDVINSRGFIIPYDILHLSRMMYFSGAYWVSKKEYMLNFPLDETLSWGMSEDVEWSKRVRKNNIFHMNIFSTVKLLKQKDKVFDYSSENDIEILKKIK